MINFLKVAVFSTALLVVLAVLVDYMNKVQAEPQIAMCRIVDMNKAVHEMPCTILASYVNEVSK